MRFSARMHKFSTRWWHFEFDPIRNDSRFHDLLRRMNLGRSVKPHPAIGLQDGLEEVPG